MEGRWTLYVARAEGITFYMGKTVPQGNVPVVPCDDAAVERAARATAPRGHVSDAWREIVREVLRAAGETA